MSQLILGWPNGSIGMLLATLAGLLLIVHAVRTRPWDIHDEHSWYVEPERWTATTMLGSFALFLVLLSLILGVGVLDRGIWPPLAIAGDILGMIAVPLTAAKYLKHPF